MTIIQLTVKYVNKMCCIHIEKFNVLSAQISIYGLFLIFKNMKIYMAKATYLLEKIFLVQVLAA